MKIGILGGSFDPPHYGHLLLAQEAYEQLGLNMVWFIPAWNPPHKKNVSSFAERWHMCHLATQYDSRFYAHPVEGHHEISHTIDTLKLLSEPDVELFLILGGDQAGSFFSWKDPEEILKLALPVVSERTMFDRERIHDHWGGQVHLLNFLDIPPLDISSSLIRWRAQEARSVRYLIPDDVADYIKQEGLYASERSIQATA